MLNLISNAQNGDKDALAELLAKFKPLLRKLSKELKYEEAESDLIIYFIKMIKNLELDGINYTGQAVNYIYKAMNHKKIDLFRKNIKNDFQEEVKLNLNFVAAKTNHNLEHKILLKKLLSSKTTNLQKIILKKKFIEGYSEKEIGEKLNISRQAVNRAKNRALNKIRVHLTN